MGKIRKTNKSIVFISHNLSAVKGLCDRVIWLDKGEILKEGNPSDVIDAYASYMASKSQFVNDISYVGGKTRWGTGEARFTSVKVLNSKGAEVDSFTPGDKVTIRLEYEAYKEIVSPVFWVGLFNEDEVRIFGSYCNKERVGEYSINGKGKLECVIDSLLMRPGNYYVMVGIYGEVGNLAIDRIGRACVFTVIHRNDSTFEKYNGYGALGVVNFQHTWRKGTSKDINM